MCKLYFFWRDFLVKLQCPLTLVPNFKFQSSSHRMHWNGHFRQIFYDNFHWSADLTLQIHKLKFRWNVTVSLTGSRGPKRNTGQISWDNSITLILFSDLTFCATYINKMSCQWLTVIMLKIATYLFFLNFHI